MLTRYAVSARASPRCPLAPMSQQVILVTPLELLDDVQVLQQVQSQFGVTSTVLWLAHEDVKPSGLASKASHYDAVISYAKNASAHSAAFLALVAQALKPGGIYFLREIVATNDTTEGLRQGKDIFAALTLAGFVNTALTLLDEPTRLVEVKSAKPAYEIGAKASLALRKPASATASGTAPKAASVWKIDSTLDDDSLEPAKAQSVAVGARVTIGAGDDDLIDESELLEAEDYVKKAVPSDCGTGATPKRKACKNCTCGAADSEPQESVVPVPVAEAPKKTVVIDTADASKSSCGSCSLGDAFRCGGCPYKGLPPFKPGEKVTVEI